MTTTALRTRRARGIHPKRPGLQQRPRAKGSILPEYLEQREIEAMVAAAPNPMARLLMLEQWRAGLRVSEALALEKRDLFLDSDRPTLRVRLGKGNKSRVVPLHSELQTALVAATTYGAVQGRLIDVSRTTAWRWVQAAARVAVERGQLEPGRHVGTHTLRHSYARHLLMNGIPLNYLSRWLGHADIKTTLIYLELVPDPTGSLASVP
jgi:site-specific recombinase XerD